MSENNHHEHHHDEHCSCGCHAHKEEAAKLNDASEAFINKHGGRGTALKFPCRFPIKVFGNAEEDFLGHAHKLVKKHVPELALEHCHITKSSKGRFVSVTIDIMADSREQLDAIYAELKADERVMAML
mgnify:CR=1 FL=1